MVSVSQTVKLDSRQQNRRRNSPSWRADRISNSDGFRSAIADNRIEPQHGGRPETHRGTPLSRHRYTDFVLLTPNTLTDTAKKIPPQMPSFFRHAVEEIAYLGPEPDR
jgi:hypothetical protein